MCFFIAQLEHDEHVGVKKEFGESGAEGHTKKYVYGSIKRAISFISGFSFEGFGQLGHMKENIRSSS